MQLLLVVCVILCRFRSIASVKVAFILNSSTLLGYVESFNLNDVETITNYISNKDAGRFLEANIPLVDFPDKSIEEIYYFRWWTYRKHISIVTTGTVWKGANDKPQTPPTPPKKFIDRFIITEFLSVVSWAGLYNSICCAAGHHFREGRWLHNSTILESYGHFWLQDDGYGGNPRQYSFWIATSLWHLFRMTGNSEFLQQSIRPLILNYEKLVSTNFDNTTGLFFNVGNRDGMECSASGEGRGFRPTLNSYMAGDAMSIARIARHLKLPSIEHDYFSKSQILTNLINNQLWDNVDRFYKVVPVPPRLQVQPPKNYTRDRLYHVRVRELHGYTPWYFKLPKKSEYLCAWKHLNDTDGFQAPYGLTTAERRNEKYLIDYGIKIRHECQWNGPSWPYATSITLTALMNVLQSPKYDLSSHEGYINKEIFFQELKKYARSHHRSLKNTSMLIPWIDENINPDTGDWISRSVLENWSRSDDPKMRNVVERKGGVARGKDYNHSTFIDIVLTGLIGFISVSQRSFAIHSLLKDEWWAYFCVDQIKYRGHYVTILWDRQGDVYNRGKGLHIYVDEIEVAVSQSLEEHVIVSF